MFEIGFEGGHGTSAGLADTFAELGFESGAELALGLATVGIVAGVLLGTLLVNWGRYKGLIKEHEIIPDEKKKQPKDLASGFLLLAPRIFPRDWLPMGGADFGQSRGMTVVGFILVRMADPLNKTGTLESFGYNQLLFEPFVGGGVVTAMSLPMIYYFGALPVLLVCAAIMLFWLCVGLFVFGPEK